MGRPKDTPALFEIIRDVEGVRKEQTTAQPPQPAEQEPAAEVAPAAEPVVTRRPKPEREPADSTEGGPFVEVIGGRVRISLSSRGTAVAVFVLGLLLAVAYTAGLAVGRQRGERDGYDLGYETGRTATEASVADGIEEARNGRPVTGLFDGVGDSPVRPARSPAETSPVPAVAPPEVEQNADRVAWVRDHTYVVVQDFRANAQADVEQARRYLADNGIETAVVELSGDWRYRLVATQGFNRDDPVQKKLADDYLARVRELGQAYFKAGGRYRLEGYFRKLTADSW